MKYTTLMLFGFFLLSSCSSVTHAPITVKAIKGAPLYPCQKISDVKVKILDGQERDKEMVLGFLKEEAGEVGGTHVHVLELTGKGQIQAQGEAYKCPSVSNFSIDELKKMCAKNDLNSCLSGAYFSALTTKDSGSEQVKFYDSACKLGDKKSCELVTSFRLADEKLKEQKILEEKEAVLNLKMKNVIQKNQPKCEAGDGKVCWDTYLELTINKFQHARYFLEKGCEYGHEKSCVVLQTKRNDENAKEQISLSKAQLATQVQTNEENSRREHARDMKNLSDAISKSFQTSTPKTQVCRTVIELGVMVTRCD